MKQYIINRYNFLLDEKFALMEGTPQNEVMKYAWEQRLENIQIELMALDSLRNQICGLNEIVEHQV